MDENYEKDDNYRRLRVSLLHGEDRLYRDLLVDTRLNAEELGVVLSAALGGENPEELFFISNGECYLPDYWIDDDGNVPEAEDRDFLKEGVNTYLPLYEADDWGLLGPSFRFIYDPDDPWIFQCTAGERETLDREEMAIVEDGAGAGILDGGGRYMSNLLQGIPQEQQIKDDDQEQAEPFNPDRLAGFDAPLDLEEEQKKFNTRIPELYRYSFEGAYPELEEGEVFSYDLAHLSGIEGIGPMMIDTFLNMTVIAQIETSDFVKSAYNRLLKKYDDNMARELIVQELREQFHGLITLQHDFSLEDYKRAIRSLR